MASDFAMDARKGPVIALCCVEGSNLYIKYLFWYIWPKRGLPASFLSFCTFFHCLQYDAGAVEYSGRRMAVIWCPHVPLLIFIRSLVITLFLFWKNLETK